MPISRTTILGSLTVFFPNAIQSPQGGLPVSLSTFQTITGVDKTVHPVQIQQPAIPDDITDEVLAAINEQMAYLGLVVSRAQVAADA